MRCHVLFPSLISKRQTLDSTYRYLLVCRYVMVNSVDVSRTGDWLYLALQIQVLKVKVGFGL